MTAVSFLKIALQKYEASMSRVCIDSDFDSDVKSCSKQEGELDDEYRPLVTRFRYARFRFCIMKSLKLIKWVDLLQAY
jgi:hypothetical protein